MGVSFVSWALSAVALYLHTEMSRLLKGNPGLLMVTDNEFLGGMVHATQSRYRFEETWDVSCHSAANLDVLIACPFREDMHWKLRQKMFEGLKTLEYHTWLLYFRKHMACVTWLCCMCV